MLTSNNATKLANLLGEIESLGEQQLAHYKRTGRKSATISRTQDERGKQLVALLKRVGLMS
jgi:hypothetical protein